MNNENLQQESVGHHLVRLSRTSRIVFRNKVGFINNGRNFVWEKTPDPYYNTCYDLWIALEGGGVFTLGKRNHRISPGTSFILPPGCRGWMHGDPEAPFHNFFCYFKLLNSKGRVMTAAQARLPVGPFQFHDVPHLRETAHALERGLRHGTPEGRRQAELALWQILLGCSMSNRADMEQKGLDPRIESVRRAIVDAPERSWTVTRMARRACLSYTQFTRIFIHQVGMSPNRYWVQQRIERACVMLKETSQPLALIAENIGYTSQQYFNRQFRQCTGMTPGHYRRAFIVPQMRVNPPVLP